MDKMTEDQLQASVAQYLDIALPKRINARTGCVSRLKQAFNFGLFKTVNYLNGLQNLIFLMFPAARSAGGAA